MTQTSFIFAHSLCQIVVASGYVEPKTNVVKVAGLSNPTRLRLPIIYVKQDKSTSLVIFCALTVCLAVLLGQPGQPSRQRSGGRFGDCEGILRFAAQGDTAKGFNLWLSKLTWPTYWSLEIHLVCLSTRCLKAICFDIMPKISIDLDPPHPIALDAI